MTTRSQPDRAGKTDTRKPTDDGGSVLQALAGLTASPPPGREPPPRPSRPSAAFLPVPPDRRARPEPGTGIIDVHLLAQARRGDVFGPANEDSRPAANLSRLHGQGPPAPQLPPPPAAASQTTARSLRMVQLRAFLFGVLCTGAIAGSLLMRAGRSEAPAQAAAADRGEP